MSHKKYFILAGLLVFFVFVIGFEKKPDTQNKFYTYLGEKAFLAWHKNNLAIYFLEKAANASQTNYYTYFLLGRVYFVENWQFSSTKNYSKSIDLNPNFKEAYYGRGLSLGFSGPIFYTNAEADFKKYIEIDNQEFKTSGYHAYGAWAGYNDLAWIYFLQNDFKNSESTARAGLELTAENPWLLNMLGTNLLAQKNCLEAKKKLTEAETLMKQIQTNQFGEAYSGDKPDFWASGKTQMERTIKENIQLCTNVDN